MNRDSDIRTLLCVLGMLLIFSSSGSAQHTVNASDVTARAIWRPSQRTYQQIRDCTGDNCVLSVMRRSRASREAIAFCALLKGGGWMSSFREMGGVDYAEETFYPPTMYNDAVTLLINGNPRVIDVDDSSYYDNLDLRRDPLYASLARDAGQPVYAWNGVGYETMQKLKGGGQRFIFMSQIKTCHGCGPVGYAHVAFDFDQARNFLGTRLVRLSRGRK